MTEQEIQRHMDRLDSLTESSLSRVTARLEKGIKATNEDKKLVSQLDAETLRLAEDILGAYTPFGAEDIRPELVTVALAELVRSLDSIEQAIRLGYGAGADV